MRKLIIRSESYDIAPKIVAKTYGFCLQTGMDYGLLRTHGFFHRNTRPPSWWTRNLWCVGGHGLSEVRDMSVSTVSADREGYANANKDIPRSVRFGAFYS